MPPRRRGIKRNNPEERKPPLVRKRMKGPELIVKFAAESWRRGDFEKATKLIHQKLKVDVDYNRSEGQLPATHFDSRVARAYPGLVTSGLSFARRSIDLFLALNAIASRRAIRTTKKYTREGHSVLFGSQFVEPLPTKSDFEKIVGAKLSDERFSRMLNSTSSRDFLNGQLFDLLLCFGSRSDMPRLEKLMKDHSLYNWHHRVSTVMAVLQSR